MAKGPRPTRSAEKLYAGKKGPKRFHLIKRAGHFDVYDLEPYVTEAVDQIHPFFAQNLHNPSQVRA